MSGRIESWLKDPFLRKLHDEVRTAGPIRSISVDLTHACNIRCDGCYFFAEGMDTHRAASESVFDEFIDRERARGTNFVTVVGGEPSLELPRLKKLYDAFRLSVATNGLIRIPRSGFENLPIGVSVWGDRATDKKLRGGGRVDVFDKALANYAGDPRAFFYYTVAPGHSHEVENVVARCVENGNRVLFNFYGDLQDRGAELGYAQGFGAVRDAIDAVIERYPEHILMSSRLAEIITTGKLFGDSWGHASCTSITADHPVNRERIQNGKPYNPHFRSYNADLVSTRRCCTGVDRDCGSCFDTWQHFSWVMLNLRRHCRSQTDFAHWVTTMYLFYFVNRLVDGADGGAMLREIHQRTGRLMSS